MRRRVMHVGWLDYLELNERLLQMVMESSFKPDFVAYITRGGDIPGVWISQRMKLPYVVIGAAHWPHGVKAEDVTIAYHCLYVTKEPPSGRMLIVDDLTDTGLTLQAATAYLFKKFRKGFWRNLWRRVRGRKPYRGITEVKTAVLWRKDVEEPIVVAPDIFVEAIGIDDERDPDGLIPWIRQPIERPGIYLESCDVTGEV